MHFTNKRIRVGTEAVALLFDSGGETKWYFTYTGDSRRTKAVVRAMDAAGTVAEYERAMYDAGWRNGDDCYKMHLPAGPPPPVWLNPPRRITNIRTEEIDYPSCVLVRCDLDGAPHHGVRGNDPSAADLAEIEACRRALDLPGDVLATLWPVETMTGERRAAAKRHAAAANAANPRNNKEALYDAGKLVEADPLFAGMEMLKRVHGYYDDLYRDMITKTLLPHLKFPTVALGRMPALRIAPDFGNVAWTDLPHSGFGEVKRMHVDRWAVATVEFGDRDGPVLLFAANADFRFRNRAEFEAAMPRARFKFHIQSYDYYDDDYRYIMQAGGFDQYRIGRQVPQACLKLTAFEPYFECAENRRLRPRIEKSANYLQETTNG